MTADPEAALTDQCQPANLCVCVCLRLLAGARSGVAGAARNGDVHAPVDLQRTRERGRESLHCAEPGQLPAQPGSAREACHNTGQRVAAEREGGGTERRKWSKRSNGAESATLQKQQKPAVNVAFSHFTHEDVRWQRKGHWQNLPHTPWRLGDFLFFFLSNLVLMSYQFALI